MSDLTIAQKKELETYERKKKERSVLAEVRRQKLNDEWKNLYAEITDLTADFNQKFHEISKEGSSVRHILASNELYIVCLLNAIFRNENTLRSITNNSSRIQEQRDILKVKSKYMEALTTELKGMRDNLNTKISEDRAMDKNFRMNIQKASVKPLDQETVKLLYQIYKKRDTGNYSRIDMKLLRKKAKSSKTGSSTISGSISRRSNLGRQSGRESSMSSDAGCKGRNSLSSLKKSLDSKAGFENATATIWSKLKLAVEEADEEDDGYNSISENDPFSFQDDSITVTSTNGAFSKDASVAAVSVDEIPDGFEIQETVWVAMQDLRERKMIKEAEVVEAVDTVKITKTLCDEVQEDIDKITNFIEHLEKTTKELKSIGRQKSSCPEFVTIIKQGQDEIDEEAVILDYDNSIFIPLDIIRETNEVIQCLGDEKTAEVRS